MSRLPLLQKQLLGAPKNKLSVRKNERVKVDISGSGKSEAEFDETEAETENMWNCFREETGVSSEAQDEGASSSDSGRAYDFSYFPHACHHPQINF